MNIFNRSAHGVAHVARKVGGVVVGVGEGAGKGLYDQGKCSVEMVKHPKRTVHGLDELVTHPSRTLQALGRGDGAGNGAPESASQKAGRAVAMVGVGVLTMGGGTVAVVAGNVSRAADSATSLERVAHAGAAGEANPQDDIGAPVSFKGVMKGAARATAQPAIDTYEAARHPKVTLAGLTDAAKHPGSLGDALGTPNRLPATDDHGQLLGRGISRLAQMSVGAGYGPMRHYQEAAGDGQLVAQAAKATRKEP
jgi:hypothetical protein